MPKFNSFKIVNLKFGDFNTTVYNYISTYLGNSGKKEELKKRLIDGSLGQDEFYN